MSWFSEGKENEESYDKFLFQIEKRISYIEGRIESIVAKETDIETKIRKIEVDLVRRLEDSYTDAKELRTLWKGRINKLKEDSTEENANLINRKKRLLGGK